MATSNLYHLSNRCNVPFFLNQRLSDLEVIYSMSELCNDSKDMLLNEVSYKVRSSWCVT